MVCLAPLLQYRKCQNPIKLENKREGEDYKPETFDDIHRGRDLAREEFQPAGTQRNGPLRHS